jgi:hypothetical protein
VAMAPAPTQYAPVAMAPAPTQYAPVAMAPAPTQYAPVAPAPTQFVPVAQAPVGQSPATAAVITLVAPRLFDRLLGAIGESLANRRNPRIQMGSAPALSPFPTTSGLGFAPTGVAQAPTAYYAPAPTAFAPASRCAPARAYGVEYVEEAQPEYQQPLPSPQTPRGKYHSFFHR